MEARNPVDNHRRREAYVGRLTRTILNELVDIGVEASQDRFPGVMRFQNSSLDGAAISLSVAPSTEAHNSTDDMGVLYTSCCRQRSPIFTKTGSSWIPLSRSRVGGPFRSSVLSRVSISRPRAVCSATSPTGLSATRGSPIFSCGTSELGNLSRWCPSWSEAGPGLPALWPSADPAFQPLSKRCSTATTSSGTTCADAWIFSTANSRSQKGDV